MAEVIDGYVKQNHIWGAPPPGQGRDDVCVKCGVKKVHGDGTECTAYHSDSVTSSEYEPIP